MLEPQVNKPTNATCLSEALSFHSESRGKYIPFQIAAFAWVSWRQLKFIRILHFASFLDSLLLRFAGSCSVKDVLQFLSFYKFIITIIIVLVSFVKHFFSFSFYCCIVLICSSFLSTSVIFFSFPSIYFFSIHLYRVPLFCFHSHIVVLSYIC